MKATLLAAVAALAGSTAASAAYYDVPLPSSAYIVFHSLDWAWAFPLPGDPSLLTYQGTQGWRLPTTAELAAAPLAVDFLKAGGNVPFGGVDPVTGATFQATNAAYSAAASAGACATPYFSSSYRHCDWQDGNGQTYAPWAGTPGAFSFADQLYVRDASSPTPEPAAWALMIGGFGFVGAALRRRREGFATA